MPQIFRGSGVGAQHVFADPVDDDPEHQRDAGQDFVEDQPPVPADQEIARAKDDDPADRAAPDVELCSVASLN